MSTNLPPNEQPKGSGIQPNNNALIGLVVIAVGGFFLLRNFGFMNWDFNWWAFFLLIPGGIMLLNVWRGYQSNGGNLTSDLRNMIGGGMVMLLIGFMLLTEMDWGRYWPLFLILGGVSLLLKTLGPAERGV